MLVQGQNVADQRIEFHGLQPGIGQPRIITELVHHAFQRGDLGNDGLRGPRQGLRILRRKPGCEFGFEPFGRQLDGRQWILDFMGDAPGYLGPRRGALGGDQLRYLVEYHDIAPAGKHRPSYQQRGRVLGQIKLPLPAGFTVVRELLANRRAELRKLRPGRDRAAQQDAGVRAQNSRRARIGYMQRKRRIEHHDARGKIRQHAGEVGVRQFQLRTMNLGGFARVTQLLGHAVEGMREQAEFVLAGHRRAPGEIAAGDRLSTFCQHLQRLREPSREQKSQRDCREKGKQ